MRLIAASMGRCSLMPGSAAFAGELREARAHGVDLLLHRWLGTLVHLQVPAVLTNCLVGIASQCGESSLFAQHGRPERPACGMHGKPGVRAIRERTIAG